MPENHVLDGVQAVQGKWQFLDETTLTTVTSEKHCSTAVDCRAKNGTVCTFAKHING